MARYLAIAALIAISALSLLWQHAESSAEAAQAEATRWRESSENLSSALSEAERNRERSELATKEAIARHQTESAALDVANRQLRQLGAANENLRAELDRRIDPDLARWMWVPADQGGPGNQGEAPRRLDGADPQATDPAVEALAVTVGKMAEWCKATDAALDSCNDDKAAIRKWAEE